MALPLVLLLASPAAFAQSRLLQCNTGNITINSGGAATPYPSQIELRGLGTFTTEVRVHLLDLNHTWPADIDILLVSPTGSSIILMSDAGSSIDIVGVNLVFDDAAAGVLPESAQIESGTYQPTNWDTGDTFPPPAPIPGGATTLGGAFNGTNPNGTWSLYVFDDVGGDGGSIAGGWCLEVSAYHLRFSGPPMPIVIPFSGPANPYPSSIAVAGLGEPVTDVTIQLNSVQHTWPDDIDALLASPDPSRNLIFMSDAGGSNAMNVVFLWFRDAHSTPLPDFTAIEAGMYRATNYLAGDSFPEPAAEPTAAATFAEAFYGAPANGTWQLFVVDDTNGDSGSIDSWTLGIAAPPRGMACNTDGLTVPTLGAATPYPSVVNFPVTGTVSRARLHLRGLSHTWFSDLDIMLQGPGGQNLTVVSDVAIGQNLTDLSLVIEDQASRFLSDSAPLVSGAFRPTNLAGADAFPAPAPAPSTATQMAVFRDRPAQGPWRLWVVDDTGPDGGSMAEWCIQIEFNEIFADGYED